MGDNLQQSIALLAEAKLCVQQCLAQADIVTNMVWLPYEERNGAGYAYNRLSLLLGDIEQFIEENME